MRNQTGVPSSPRGRLFARFRCPPAPTKMTSEPHTTRASSPCRSGCRSRSPVKSTFRCSRRTNRIRTAGRPVVVRSPRPPRPLTLVPPEAADNHGENQKPQREMRVPAELAAALRHIASDLDKSGQPALGNAHATEWVVEPGALNWLVDIQQTRAATTIRLEIDVTAKNPECLAEDAVRSEPSPVERVSFASTRFATLSDNTTASR
jgi:hypothetical protein